MKYLSPAKINLFFRVLGKRKDGYHEIASLYQAIDLYDELFISDSAQEALTASDPELLCDETNLVWKARRLFRAQFGGRSCHIHLEKKIPMQAGLGGGSSNAATTLWALNEQNGRPATEWQLLELAAKLGSDVPFFFSSGTAYCTGRGEKLEPYSLPAPLSGWIVKPPFGLSTPAVYQETRVSELPQRDPQDALIPYNDLEPAAFRLEPRLFLIKRDGFTMTGSGTAFFTFQSEKPHLEEGFIVPFRSLQRPLHSWY
ncbi:MAG TPA: 4-(cytidine 5'-diphospho)-2-C-methyl-D-erythritol kinase [Chlamydiales bacterium]|jgi:4-diphosphocytidyl-2-C-methyl-D-erythritol kinase|nr:4-(cytidine 5'-diphospho)-2-C-methyl-D-erythritol kinase [Chlamydiales bacterium]